MHGVRIWGGNKGYVQVQYTGGSVWNSDSIDRGNYVVAVDSTIRGADDAVKGLLLNIRKGEYRGRD